MTSMLRRRNGRLASADAARAACTAVVAAAAMAAPMAVAAQTGPPSMSHRPWLKWQTVRTAHFDVHFPLELSSWGLTVAARLEAIRAAVAAEVGHVPHTRVQVMVDEVGHVSGGLGWPLQRQPLLFLWPESRVPAVGRTHHLPDPLVLHEFTHLAHLSRPSSSGWERLWPRLLPPSLDLGPLVWKSPQWVEEGYASYMEGKVLGGGTPYSVQRAGLLRQWALEGSFPSYDEINGSRRYMGARISYAVGSAFLEWLESRRGAAAFRSIWAALAGGAGLEPAFVAEFGAPPRELYGRFVRDVSARAAEARALLVGAGLAEGDTLPGVGEVTAGVSFSADGRYVAAAVRSVRGGSRVVVVDLTRPASIAASLLPFAGRPHEEPRLTPDGSRVLVVRREPQADGTLRADLFVWDWHGGHLRRVTHNAGIHTADESPDGRHAVADRCVNGTCDLVLVDLATGSFELLAAGSATEAWSRPRWSAAGTLVAAHNRGGRWRIAWFDSLRATPRPIDPDDGAHRHAPAFAADGGVIAGSERGGIAHLVRLDSDGAGEVVVARATGAALAPAPHPNGDLYFLRLHSSGLRLARLPASALRPLAAVELPSTLAPAAPPPRRPTHLHLAPAELAMPLAYGAGPRRWGFLPTAAYAAAGRNIGVAVTNVDPIGRLGITAQSAVSQGTSASEGASLGITWRGTRPALTAELFATRAAASAYRGAAAHMWLDHPTQPIGYGWRAGAAVGRMNSDVRALGVAEATLAVRTSAHPLRFSGDLAAHLAGGATADSTWQRAVTSLRVRVMNARYGADASITRGRVNARAPSHERFSIGGTATSLLWPALLSQRIGMPALSVQHVSAHQVTLLRAAAITPWLDPYVWSAMLSPQAEAQHVIGVERMVTLPRVPYARLPGEMSARAGAGYVLQQPRALQLYLELSLRP